VRGKLWLNGLDEPVKLDLAGNACADLAVVCSSLRIPPKLFRCGKKPKFNPLQRGKIGNLSASQKVRVFTIPDEEAFEMIERGEKPPGRMANALYLEWFSEGNGRVVIESANFELTFRAGVAVDAPPRKNSVPKTPRRAGKCSQSN